MGASAVDLDVSVQVSRVTRCTSAGPPVESRRPGGRSESNDCFSSLCSLVLIRVCVLSVCSLDCCLIRSAVPALLSLILKWLRLY